MSNIQIHLMLLDIEIAFTYYRPLIPRVLQRVSFKYNQTFEKKILSKSSATQHVSMKER